MPNIRPLELYDDTRAPRKPTGQIHYANECRELITTRWLDDLVAMPKTFVHRSAGTAGNVRAMRGY